MHARAHTHTRKAREDRRRENGTETASIIIQERMTTCAKRSIGNGSVARCIAAWKECGTMSVKRRMRPPLRVRWQRRHFAGAWLMTPDPRSPFCPSCQRCHRRVCQCCRLAPCFSDYFIRKSLDIIWRCSSNSSYRREKKKTPGVSESLSVTAVLSCDG